MSAEPKPADSLQQLKELMMGDEQRAIALLRERLDTLDEESVERLARDLAAALRRRREEGEASFDEFVAALQSGTESAIQRSVSEDKSRLSKALFPIMGPAIRNYVIDLFRGMVEDLNETIRDTTSAERLKWRAQAKLAGKSYSEYVLLKTRSFRIDEAYLMQRETGLLLMHAARNPEEEADEEADLVSGMFTAIRSFVRDSFADEDAPDDDSSELDSFTFGEREVLIEAGPGMVLAAVAHGVPPGSTREELKAILEELHAHLGDRLDHFSGDTATLESGRPILRRALLENRAESARAGQGSGGLWRAWAFLGVLGIATLAYLAVGYREQSTWNRFERSLRGEPGVAITAVEPDGWWRRRLVRGLRDPLAVDPAAKLGEFGLDPEKVSFDFALMESLDPAFASEREARMEAGQRRILEAVTGLRSELEKTTVDSAKGEDVARLTRELEQRLAGIDRTIRENAAATERARDEALRRLAETLLRSRFGEVAGLELSFSEDGRRLELSGALGAEDYRRVTAQVEPLSAWLEVDTADLTEDSSRRIREVMEAISRVAIPYRSGTLEEEESRQVAEVAELARQLDALAAEAGTAYRFEVVAHPLIGENRDANRVIERDRSRQVRDALIGAGIAPDRIDALLSEELDRSGEGVSVRAVEVTGAMEGGGAER